MRRMILVSLLVAASALPAKAERRTLAVVPLAARGVEKDLALAATDALETILAENEAIALIERSRVEAAVESIVVKDAAGRTSSVSVVPSESTGEDVLAKIANETKASFLLVGSVAELGGKRTLNARLSSTATRTVVAAKSIAFRDRSDMDGAVRTLAALVLDKLAALDGEGGAVSDASQRRIEQALAEAHRMRFCDASVRDAATVVELKAGELKLKLRAKGVVAVDDALPVIGADGNEKGTVTITAVNDGKLEARGSFVNSGDSMKLPSAGDAVRRGAQKLALVPLFNAAALGRDGVQLAQAVAERLSEDEACTVTLADEDVRKLYGKAAPAARAKIARTGAAAAVEWRVELDGKKRRIAVKAVAVPGGKPKAEFGVDVEEGE